MCTFLLANARRSNIFESWEFQPSPPFLVYGFRFHAGNESECNKHKSQRLTEPIGFKTQALAVIALQRPPAQGIC